MELNGFSNGRSALIGYGSETGTAQDIGEEIGKLARRLRFAARVTDLNHISLNDLIRSNVVIISISTTGQGDLPANARAFWTKLRSGKLKPGVLSAVQFTAFGIGDSSYPNFNWAARKLSNRLLQLGAQCFCERGESDEQHPEGIDGLFSPWSTTLRDRLLQVCPLPAGVSVISDDKFLHPEWRLKVQNPGVNGCAGLFRGSTDDLDTVRTNSAISSSPDCAKSLAKLVSNERLTPDTHWQDVRLFEFSVSQTEYSPGDVLTIYPKNSSEDVDELIHLMQWDDVADSPVTFVASSDPALSGAVANSLPPFALRQQTSFRDLIQSHLDLNAIPRRSFFAMIAHFTADEMQKERLMDFTKPELIDELYDYTTRPRRSILEVLQEFDTVKIPLEWSAAVFPHIRGRQFSIASGGRLKRGPQGDTRIQLLVAIVQYRTVIKKLRRGLCTRYLSELPHGSNLELALSKSGMTVSLDRPAILIGPGTGVAPLRAIIHERAYLMREHMERRQLLFFGARNRDADFFFRDEWHAFGQESGLQVHTAFSRDQSSKAYVQDKLRDKAAAVFDLLQHNAVIYLCGSSGKMPQAVRVALIDVIEQEGQQTREEAEHVLSALEKSGRYQQETW